jgi:sugar phosphate isomerase/epimerase
MKNKNIGINLKYAIEASVFLWPPTDRISQYKDPISFKKVFEQLSRVKGIQGIELYHPYDFKDINIIKHFLKSNGISVSAVGIGFFSEAKWQNGGVTSNNKKIRTEAIDVAKKAIEVAEDLNTKNIVFWPGHDGYDYFFQIDYLKKWDLMVEALREIASFDKDLYIGIEYKNREPRTHQLVPTASKALKLAKDTGMDNVGVVLDIGHSLLCGENPAEEINYLIKENKLFHLHSNDNYSDWDYDMLPGTVHFWENIEVYYWLNKLGYDGWINFDIFPTRIDALESSNLCIENTKRIINLIKSLDVNEMERMINEECILEMQAYLWKKIFK